MAKRYYWLQLQENFFSDKRLKKLRKIAGGDTYTVIYLKMMLASLKTEGLIEYEGVEESLAKEIALALDEDEDNVSMVLSFLLNSGLLINIGNNQYFLPIVAENLGSEGASAKRMRELRERQRLSQRDTLTSQCDTLTSLCDETSLCDGEKRREENRILDNKYISEQEPDITFLKRTYGEFKHVRLTDKEIDTLTQTFGQDLTDEYITYLDEYIENHDKDYKNHYLTIRNWIKKNKKLDANQQTSKKTQFNNFKQRDNVDFDELEKKLLGGAG